MSKYINADALLLKTSVEIAAEKARKATDIGYHTFLDGFLELTQINLNKMPAADVVEVVRCKDCTRALSVGCYMYVCGRVKDMNYYTADDFCSKGERKETE